MKTIEPDKQRAFAVDVVRQLREHGHQAYWAGGCVRDHLLNRVPYDYDVATSAHPEEIRGVFKHRKTLAIGAAFGVMTIVGPRGAGQVEVTTFRQDVSYSDGRHPDRIEFSSPEEDAQRRDFTINGMFFDPVENKVIDFVGGEADLRAGIVRAIGDAQARFTEDKLRMLRAVRFASVFNFELEAATLAAIRSMADQVKVVSAERIADEMRNVLVQPARARAVRLWRETGLLQPILPEIDVLVEAAANRDRSDSWNVDLAMLDALVEPSFALALAVVLSISEDSGLAAIVGERWRLARKEIDEIQWLLVQRSSLEGAAEKPWSTIQPLLISTWAEDLVQFHRVRQMLRAANLKDVDFCREKLGLPAAELDPAPLITGSDLIELGIPRGPVFATLLQAARDAQLDGQLADRDSAMEFVRERLKG